MNTLRRARVPYRCTYGCGGWIKSGSLYLRHALKQDGKITATVRECGTCATANGRAGLLERKTK